MGFFVLVSDAFFWVGVKGDQASPDGYIIPYHSGATVEWVPTHGEILLNQTEIRLYLPCICRFGTKRTSVWCQIIRKMVNTIRFRFDLITFRKYLSVYTFKPIGTISASKSEQKNVCSVCDEYFFAYVTEDSKKKIHRKKIIKRFFFVILEFSETYYDLVAIKIGAKLNSSSKMFIEKSHKSRKLQIKIFLKEKNWQKSKKCFCICFKTLRIFWNQKPNFPTFEGGGLHVFN